ncbi:hypothetical protein EK21DRAFT_111122 [Setomelanomma holmii]|uniref:Uncharacterized protein n=1 Tax=Setomelanomma holmii TaxID=210430 RepID=A0A9P4HAX3_9PLEO|nr:hypothetical protein EK21DRAFT_111122 [Setomelanomma holmii]
MASGSAPFGVQTILGAPAAGPVGGLSSLAFLTEQQLTHFVGTSAVEIVNAWREVDRGRDPRDGSVVIQRAVEWLQVAPRTIAIPDLTNTKRSSEAYFIVWAQTAKGRAEIESWNRMLPGLTYKRTFSRFETQRFVRELLTKGTKLNKRVRCEQSWDFEVIEMMALVMLRSPTRTFSKEMLRREIFQLFKRMKTGDFVQQVASAMDSIFHNEDVRFDISFLVVKHTSMGWPIYHLGPGQENTILEARLYDHVIEKLDVPYKPANSTIHKECPLSFLPNELKVRILCKLFRLGTDIHVILEPTRQVLRPPFKYNFVVFGPEDDPSSALPDTRCSRQPGPIENFFAITEANAELRALALQVFYNENKFVLGPFASIAGETDINLYHLGHWK